MEHATRDAFHVVLRHGGPSIKPYAVVASRRSRADRRGWVRALEILLRRSLLVLPFALALLTGEADRRSSRCARRGA
jgi:hypothetical protein